MVENKKIIAVCVARIQDDATNSYIAALNDIVSTEGYGVFVYNTSTVPDIEKGYSDASFYVYSLMDFSVIDVVIIHEETIQNELVVQNIVQNAKNSDIPVIILGERRNGCVNIKFNQEEGFAALVRHMVKDHHLTRFHFMAGIKNNAFSDNRLAVFKKILEENQLPFEDTMVSYGDFWSGPAEDATERLIASGELPQAIICANDKMAIAVCGVLNRHGIRIPEQVAVTGFDGIYEINFSSPRITSACCESADIARKTLEVLQNLEQYKNKTESIFVPARLAVAESCGCKEKEPVDASRYLNSLNDRFFLYQDEAIKLSAMVAGVQLCESVEQVAEQLRHPIFYDMCCVMETEFLKEEICPEEYCRNPLKDNNREMFLLFDSNQYENFQPYPFPLKQIIPSVQYCMENHRVIVFTALQHLGIPMGYVCFFFRYLDNTQSARITQMVNALNAALGGYRNMRYKNFLVRQIDEMYRIDTLTGLYNRRGFALAYQKLSEYDWKNVRMTIILADLDRLKYINDTFGHKEGDFAIHAVAEALRQCCPENSLFARFGGDEMLAVCPGKIEPEKVRTMFGDYFRQFNQSSEKPYEVNASIGVYITEKNEVLNFDELIEQSDRLMYEEKERHRNKEQHRKAEP